MRNLAQMIQKVKSLEETLAHIKTDLADARFSGEGGGGSVRAEVDGQGKLHQVKLAQSVADCTNPDDRVLLEGLIVAAVNAALEQASQAKKQKIKELTGGLPLPADFDLPL